MGNWFGFWLFVTVFAVGSAFGPSIKCSLGIEMACEYDNLYFEGRITKALRPSPVLERN